MWFKRTPKNRRLARQFVLDVKLRSSQLRARRVRMAALALGGIFAAVAGLYLAWQASQLALHVLLYDNKAFALLEIDAQTDGVIAPDQLRRWTGVKPGQNLFAVDLASVQRNLSMVSLIRSVSLEKVLPHCLRVRVTEREPVAQVNLARLRADGAMATTILYLDADGWVILPLQPNQYAAGSQPPIPDQLPLINGLNPNEAQPGRRLDTPQVMAALALIQAFERSTMQGLAELKSISVSAPDVLLARTAQGSEITFGLQNLDRQLLRWRSIFEEGQQLNKAIATVDLAVSTSIPVTWVDALSVPPVPPKSPKPLRPRKKHV